MQSANQSARHQTADDIASAEPTGMAQKNMAMTRRAGRAENNQTKARPTVT